ncbi:MAG: portal protein [Pseudodesulfovibrio sp.]
MQTTELARSLLTRFNGLEQSRQPWIGSWQELTEYMLPRKDSFAAIGASGVTRGQTGDERIFDSTPMHALEMLASSLGGLLTNPAMPWFDIKTRDPKMGDDKAVRTFLQQARERIAMMFNAEDSGFQTNVHELYLDIALLGTAVMYVEADPQTVVRFSTRPLGEVYVAESARGAVDTVYRRYSITARQAAQEWGASLADETKKKAEDKPDEKIEILHAVFPRTDRDPFGIGAANFPFGSIYMEMANENILEESGYLEMPYLVPRWAKAAGETYGRGPGQTALSDTRVLNAMARTALMAAEKMSDPPLMVPDDGFLGAVRSGPGGLSYYRAGSSDRIEPLPVRVDLGATENMMAQRRESIRRIFLGDQLAPEGPAVTATEAVIRQSEKMRVLGPVLGRLQTEFLSPLIKRVFNIMLRAGALPSFPEGLAPDDIEVRYNSPVSRAQKQYEAQGLSQTLQYLSPLMADGDPFGIMDNFETDRMARHVAEMFGTPSDYMKPEPDVAASRTEKSKTQSTMQTTAMMVQGAAIAKTLSEAHTDRPNVLTDLWQMLTNTGAVQSDAEAEAETETANIEDGSLIPTPTVSITEPPQEVIDAG